MPHTHPSFLRTLRLAWLALFVLAGCAAPVFAKVATDSGRTTGVHDTCSWDRPGVNPYMGDVVGAVDRYTDIPLDVRQRLKERMAKREYDDLVSIRRDAIVSERGQQYNAAIRDMYFGAGSICHTVSRDAWTPAMEERGLVYCERNLCVLVPTVCRNVSRIARRGVSPEHAEGPDEAFAAIPPVGVAPEVSMAGSPAVPMAGPGSPLGGDGVRSFTQAAAVGTEGGVGLMADGANTGSSAGGGGGGSAAGSTQLAPVSPGSVQVPSSTSTPTLLPIITDAVPEPETWDLLLAGLATLVVVVGWRRAAAQ